MACLSVWQHLWVGRQHRGASESWKCWQGSLHHSPWSCCSPNKFWALSKEGSTWAWLPGAASFSVACSYRQISICCWCSACSALEWASLEPFGRLLPAGHREGLALLPPACDEPQWERVSSWADESHRFPGIRKQLWFLLTGFHYNTKQRRTCALWCITVVSVQKALSRPLFSSSSKAAGCGLVSCELSLSLEVSKAKAQPTWSKRLESRDLQKLPPTNTSVIAMNQLFQWQFLLLN